MEINEKFSELLNEIEKQESQIEEIARQLEESGSLDETMEIYLENTREQLRQRKLELIAEFQPNIEPIKIEIQDGEVSPKAKEHPNTPSSFSNRTNKYPLYSVHEIEVEKLPTIEKKSISERLPPISPNRSFNVYSPSNKKEFFTNKNFFFSSADAGLNLNNDEEEYKKLSKEYQECREIMNTAHETMLMIKEKLLELKEMEIENKMNCFENSINNKRGGIEEWNQSWECGKGMKKPPKSQTKTGDQFSFGMRKIVFGI